MTFVFVRLPLGLRIILPALVWLEVPDDVRRIAHSRVITARAALRLQKDLGEVFFS